MQWRLGFSVAGREQRLLEFYAERKWSKDAAWSKRRLSQLEAAAGVTAGSGFAPSSSFSCEELLLPGPVSPGGLSLGTKKKRERRKEDREGGVGESGVGESGGGESGGDSGGGKSDGESSEDSDWVPGRLLKRRVASAAAHSERNPAAEVVVVDDVNDSLSLDSGSPGVVIVSP